MSSTEPEEKRKKGGGYRRRADRKGERRDGHGRRGEERRGEERRGEERSAAERQGQEEQGEEEEQEERGEGGGSRVETPGSCLCFGCEKPVPIVSSCHKARNTCPHAGSPLSTSNVQAACFLLAR